MSGISEKICNIDMSTSKGKTSLEVMSDVWGKYEIYNIFNVSEDNFIENYKDMANSLGRIRLCHPVNDKSTKFSDSRDIKYDPNIPHFFASNSRQPLHTDYAYYEKSKSPDWLMLYCISPSEYGGITDILSLETLKSVMKKYDEKLLKKIEIEVKWHYKGVDGEVIHKKPILDSDGINWNYWQIKKEINTPEVIGIANEFFDFLENKIVQSRIFDFSKKWNRGDCIIFKDKTNLHGRSSFLGDRWLKDHAFFSNK